VRTRYFDNLSVEAVAQRMQGYIRDVRQDRRPATRQFVGFEVRA